MASSTTRVWPAITPCSPSSRTATTVPANGASTGSSSDTARTLRDRGPDRGQDVLGRGVVARVGGHVRPGDVALRVDHEHATELAGVADRAGLHRLLAHCGH